MFRTALRTSARSFLHRSSTVALRSSTLPFTNHHLTAYRYISQEARSKIQSAIDSKPIVLFMKGTPEEPQCGFSRAVCQILDIHGVPEEKMKTYNVLGDEELRTAIKEFSLVSVPYPILPTFFSLVEIPLISPFFTETGLQYLKYTSMENSSVDVIFF